MGRFAGKPSTLSRPFQQTPKMWRRLPVRSPWKPLYPHRSFEDHRETQGEKKVKLSDPMMTSGKCRLGSARMEAVRPERVDEPNFLGAHGSTLKLTD